MRIVANAMIQVTVKSHVHNEVGNNRFDNSANLHFILR